MVKKNKITIQKIETKILKGKFGDGKYFGYGDNKIISLVKIALSNKVFGFGESLVGIYSPKLFDYNVNYLSSYFLNKTIDESLLIIKNLQNNKFFFYQGLIKSILAAFEIAILSNYSKLNNCAISTSISKLLLKKKINKSKYVNVYASAGSIKSSIKDLKSDFTRAKSLNFNKIKIRLNLNTNYKEKIIFTQKFFNNFAIDLIANTYKKNNNQKKLTSFLKFIQKRKILWLEEPINVEEITNKEHLKKFKRINVSYGENFTSYYDYLSLLEKKYIKFLNIDISHCSIGDIIKLILYIRKNEVKTRIILHCWGSLINLNTSIELASIFPKEIILVEFPITKFELNDFFIDEVTIKNSKVKSSNYLELIENNYDKKINYNQKEKDKFRFD
jgi:L-alanine-DL-glutamate epimerase-like enolase superfamily enzyme